MLVKIWIFVVFIDALYCICLAESGEDCDKQSLHWDNETYSTLIRKCQPLAYDEQFCVLNDDNLDCLRQRASMHDQWSCECHKNDRYVTSHPCLYLEVCAFADPNFKCDADYLCSVDEDDVINCTAPNLPYHTNRCLRGLIHCPASERCLWDNFAYDYAKVYRDHCGKDLRDAFGTNVTIYYIDRVLHDNTNHTFMNMTVLFLAEGDGDNDCIRGPVDSSPPNPAHEDWKIVVPVLSAFILITLLAFGSWKLREIRKRQNKKLDGLLDRTFNHVRGFVQFVPDTSETPESSTIDNAEIPDPIPPEGIPLPNAVEEEDIPDIERSAVENEPADFQPEDRNDLSHSDVENVGHDRLHSYDNSAYSYERLIRPSVSSVGSAFSGYSSKYGPELLEASSIDRSGSTSTVSGYSMKNLSSLIGSVERRSSANIPHNDRQPENNHLQAISEGDITEPLNGSATESQGSCIQDEVRVYDSNSLLYHDPTNLDNPSYMASS